MPSDPTTPRPITAYGSSRRPCWRSYPGVRSGWARARGGREPGERHLAVHEGHLTVVTPRDLPLLTQAGERIMQTGWTGDAGAVRARFDEAGAAGVTEILYMAAGPDIPGELAAMADARA